MTGLPTKNKFALAGNPNIAPPPGPVALGSALDENFSNCAPLINTDNYPTNSALAINLANVAILNGAASSADQVRAGVGLVGGGSIGSNPTIAAGAELAGVAGLGTSNETGFVYRSGPGTYETSMVVAGSITVSGPSNSTPPVVRGSGSSYTNSLGSYHVAFPVGVVSGDFAVLIIGCNADTVVAPSGWTVVDADHVTNRLHNAVFTKILTDSDISTGYVSVSSTSGTANAVCMIVCFEGNTGGLRTFAAQDYGGTITTDTTPRTGDYAIFTGEVIQGTSVSAITSSAGTLLTSAINPDQYVASAAAFGLSLTADGAVTDTIGMTNQFYGSTGYVIVIKTGAGTESRVVDEIDFSGSGVSLSFTDSIASVEITGGGGGGGSLTPSTQSGGSYTLALTDASGFISFTNSGGCTVTVPPHSSVAFSPGDAIAICQAAAGPVTIVAGSGVTINYLSTLSLVTFGQYAVAQLVNVGTDQWILFGAIGG